jgi:hypothetical protein
MMSHAFRVGPEEGCREHTETQDIIRVISARAATPAERKIYEEG